MGLKTILLGYTILLLCRFMRYTISHIMLLKILFEETVAFDAVSSVWDTSKQTAKMQRKTLLSLHLLTESADIMGGWQMERRPGTGLLDLTGCPGSVITVLMLSPSKVQYCDNWRMAANLTRVQWIKACGLNSISQRTRGKKVIVLVCI